LTTPVHALLKKVNCLVWWELLRLWGPETPAASPLKLRKIFDKPEPSEENEFEFVAGRRCG
jgi:hypothetical protein